jgi:ribonuclease P protein component
LQVPSRTRAHLGWPKAARLRRRPEFVAVQDHGRRKSGAALVVLALPPPSNGAAPCARFGLVVSRKVGNAVMRNRIKRQLREALRHLRALAKPADVVIIARAAAASADGPSLRRELRGLLDRAGLLAPSGATPPPRETP